MKRIITAIILIISIFFIFIFVSEYKQEVKLEKEKSVEKQVEDFILHMKVERADSGVEVHQSLQYVGEDTVKIEHQTPLVSISLNNQNHDYTGSLVSKKLEKGSIYYQDPVEITKNEQGACHLYAKAKFLVNGEIVHIEHSEQLMFH